jgi:hypothetical protein
VAALVIVLIVAGCSARVPHDGARSSDPSASGFTGSWAQEFADASAQANDYQRRILEDGRITASERAEVQARVSACMRDLGHRYTFFDDGGAESEPLPGMPDEDVETVAAHVRRCGREHDGDITYLYNEVRRNPEKRDEAEITVACLRAAGLVGTSYTERRWRAEDDEGVYSFDEWDAGAVNCRLDPLGLWRDE